MGWVDSLMNVLGLRRPLLPRDADRLLFSEAARARLAEIPRDHALHITTVPQGDGRGVQVSEGPAEGPPPPGYDEPIVVGDADLQRMAGLLLDRRDGRWTVAVDLSVYGRETPNPNGRLYLTDRWLDVGRPLFFTRVSEAPKPPLARRLLQIVGVVSVLFRENTVTVERVPDTSWDRLDQAVDGALRQYFLLCGQALDEGDSLPPEDGLAKEVLAVLHESVIPGIHRDGGDLVFHGVENGVVRLTLVGACTSCPSATVTLQAGIERTLFAAFPGRVTAVRAV